MGILAMLWNTVVKSCFFTQKENLSSHQQPALLGVKRIKSKKGGKEERKRENREKNAGMITSAFAKQNYS